MEDILTDKNNDLQVVKGDFATGASEMQEVAAILMANQGEYKEFPLIGANLIRSINSKKTRSDIEGRVKIQLALDGKDYNEIKNQLKIGV